MNNKEAIEFVKQQAELQIGKPLSKMTEGEKDEALVIFKSETNCHLLGRIYPFDEDKDCPYYQQQVTFQVERGLDIEDYLEFEQARESYYQSVYESNMELDLVNKIYNNCAIEGMRELYNKYGECIDLCITDPPYKISSRGKVGKGVKQKPSGVLTRNDGKVFDNNSLKPEEYVPLIYKLLKPNSHFYIFTNVSNLNNMINVAEKTGFKLHNILIWEKNNCTPNQFYMKNCEYILFFRKGKAKWINNIGTKTVHKFDNVKNKTHPTEKPVELLKLYIENSSSLNDVVLDPFMGSFSLAEACYKSNRHFVGYEIDKEFYDKGWFRLSLLNNNFGSNI